MAVAPYLVGDVLRYGAYPSTQYVRVVAITPTHVTWEGVDQLKNTPVVEEKHTFESALDAFGTL